MKTNPKEKYDGFIIDTKILKPGELLGNGDEKILNITTRDMIVGMMDEWLEDNIEATRGDFDEKMGKIQAEFNLADEAIEEIEEHLIKIGFNIPSIDEIDSEEGDGYERGRYEKKIIHIMEILTRLGTEVDFDQERLKERFIKEIDAGILFEMKDNLEVVDIISSNLGSNPDEVLVEIKKDTEVGSKARERIGNVVLGRISNLMAEINQTDREGRRPISMEEVRERFMREFTLEDLRELTEMQKSFVDGLLIFMGSDINGFIKILEERQEAEDKITNNPRELARIRELQNLLRAKNLDGLHERIRDLAGFNKINFGIRSEESIKEETREKATLEGLFSFAVGYSTSNFWGMSQANDLQEMVMENFDLSEMSQEDLREFDHEFGTKLAA